MYFTLKCKYTQARDNFFFYLCLHNLQWIVHDASGSLQHQKSCKRGNTFSWACLNKVTVSLGLSSVLTLYPVSSLSRKLVAYQRSFVKRMYVSCIILSRTVWIPYRRTSPAGVGGNWPVWCSQGERGNSCVQGKEEPRSQYRTESPTASKHDLQSFWFLTALNQNWWQDWEDALLRHLDPKQYLLESVPGILEKWIQQVERWPANYTQRPSFVFVLPSIPKPKSFRLSLTK